MNIIKLYSLAALAAVSVVVYAAGTPFSQQFTATWTDPNAADVGVDSAKVAVEINGVAGTPDTVKPPFTPYKVTKTVSVGDKVTARVALCNPTGCSAFVTSAPVSVTQYLGVPAVPTSIQVIMQ